MLSLKYIVIPLGVALLSQCIKFLIEIIKYKKFDLMRFFNGMGGMPSTHSALVASISTIIFFDYGISPLFAITFIFSLIVIYDSMGVRYESGKQAQIINKMMGSNLEEHIGHSPIESLVGVVVGIIFTLIICLITK